MPLIDVRPVDGVFSAAQNLTDTEAAKSRPHAIGGQTLTKEDPHAMAGRKAT